jgi:uncharacterized coiled-coil protein SlyX
MRFRRSQRIDDRVPALERRIAHLEQMIEGLQDAVHRETVRTQSRLDEIARELEPAELTRKLSKDQRERGL